MRFYAVKMPDGVIYAAAGKSQKTVAKGCGVKVSAVSIGVDLLHTPDISEYDWQRDEVEQDTPIEVVL